MSPCCNDGNTVHYVTRGSKPKGFLDENDVWSKYAAIIQKGQISFCHEKSQHSTNSLSFANSTMQFSEQRRKILLCCTFYENYSRVSLKNVRPTPFTGWYRRFCVCYLWGDCFLPPLQVPILVCLKQMYEV
jgi:hypothetical protein